MSYKTAYQHALDAGASREEIEAEITRTLRHPSNVRRAQAAALQMHPWNNRKDDWVRLAAALA